MMIDKSILVENWRDIMNFLLKMKKKDRIEKNRHHVNDRRDLSDYKNNQMVIIQKYYTVSVVSFQYQLVIKRVLAFGQLLS